MELVLLRLKGVEFDCNECSECNSDVGDADDDDSDCISNKFLMVKMGRCLGCFWYPRGSCICCRGSCGGGTGCCTSCIVVGGEKGVAP